MTPTSVHDQPLEERLADLDRRLRSIEGTLRSGAVRRRPTANVELSSVPPPPSPRARPGHAVPLTGAVSPAHGPVKTAENPPARATRRAPGASLSDVLGGRVLAWIGGVAMLLGIALFLVLAISRGWIGIEARVLLSGLGSCLLMGAGVWLHARRGRTEASVVLVGVATAGLFATLLVASHLYGLIAPLLAVIASLVVGALATALAIRWAGHAIAVLGLIGALASPILVGAPTDLVTVAVLGVAAACATWTALRQRWNWLGLMTVLVCAPQWGLFVLKGRPVAIDLAVLAWFGLLGMVGAIGIEHDGEEGMNPAAASLLTLSGLVVAVVGAVALRNTADGHGAELWLAALAVVHTATGVVRLPRVSVSTSLRRLAIVLAVILADVAFGFSATGIVLVIGWGAAAIASAALSRWALGRESDRRLMELGVGAHIALTLVRALLTAPPGTLASGTPQLLPLLSVAALAASCLICGQLMRGRARDFTLGLNAIGFAAIAYLTADALSGSALAAAWAIEALALIQLDAHTGDRQARWGAIGFLTLALGHALAREAPPVALVTGAASLQAAAVALGAIALTTGWAARVNRAARNWLLAGTAVTLLYLASVAIISVFQPSAGVDSGLLDLSVRQQGQVLLSACWACLGLTGLILGLRTDLAGIRNGAFALLLVTVAKVFLYDLATLTSLYRVVSFIALGLLLLAGAFAYQRLRPPPVPDMRSVHPSQR